MPLTISAALIQQSFSRQLIPENFIEVLKQDWLPHVNKRCFQGEWDVLPLRCAKQHLDNHPILQAFSIEEIEDYTNLPSLTKNSYLLDLLNTLKCKVLSIRLMRLKPGAKILPHSDCQLSLEYGKARLHIPVQTNEEVTFTVNGHNLPMKVGELWYINAHQEHSVTNDGKNDRINLVIDCIANNWLKECLLKAELVF